MKRFLMKIIFMIRTDIKLLLLHCIIQLWSTSLLEICIWSKFYSCINFYIAIRITECSKRAMKLKGRAHKICIAVNKRYIVKLYLIWSSLRCITQLGEFSGDDRGYNLRLCFWQWNRYDLWRPSITTVSGDSDGEVPSF